MVTDAIINFIVSIIQYVISLLPVYSGLNPEIVTAVTYMQTTVTKLQYLVPLSTLYTIFAAVVTIELSIAIFRAIAWLLHYNQHPQS